MEELYIGSIQYQQKQPREGEGKSVPENYGTKIFERHNMRKEKIK